ncbi:hypothetical protein Tco_0911096, partial [Tanacetum coccineum]
LQCLYIHIVKECECLAQKLSKQTKSVNKEVHNKLLKSFAKLENHLISLEVALQQFTQQKLPQNRKQAEIHSNVLKPGMNRIPTTTTQTRTPQLPHASRNTNPYVSKSTGVNHYTSVNRPQLKSYQVKDMVVPNNSQVKFNHKDCNTPKMGRSGIWVGECYFIDQQHKIRERPLYESFKIDTLD